MLLVLTDFFNFSINDITGQCLRKKKRKEKKESFLVIYTVLRRWRPSRWAAGWSCTPCRTRGSGPPRPPRRPPRPGAPSWPPAATPPPGPPPRSAAVFRTFDFRGSNCGKFRRGFEGSFSAVSKPIYANDLSFCRIFKLSVYKICVLLHHSKQLQI